MHGGKVHPEPGTSRKPSRISEGDESEDVESKPQSRAGSRSLAHSRSNASQSGFSASARASAKISGRSFSRTAGKDDSSWASMALGSGGRAKAGDVQGAVAKNVIYPGSTWYHWFWYLTVFAAMMTGIVDPFEVAFATQPGLAPFGDTFALLAYMALVIFAADIVMKFFLAYQDSKSNKLITKKRQIALHYLSSKFWVDLLATFPLEVVIAAAAGVTDPASQEARYISLVKFLYLLRMYRVLDLFEELEFYMVFSQLAIVIVRNFTYVLYSLHWGACCYWLIAELVHPAPFPPAGPQSPWAPPMAPSLASATTAATAAALSANGTTRHLLQLATSSSLSAIELGSSSGHTSATHIARHLLQATIETDPVTWVGRHYERFDNESLVNKYIYSIYLSIATMTSLSDSDFFEANTAECIFTIIFLFVCFILAAYMLGTVSMLVNKAEKRHKVYRERVQMIEQYSEQQVKAFNPLPASLLASLDDHMELYFLTEDVRDETVLALYPSSMRRRVLRHLYLEPLHPCYIFKGCKKKFMDTFLAACRIELFLPGDQLFEEGDLVNELFIIVSGKVRTSRTIMPEGDVVLGDGGGSGASALGRSSSSSAPLSHRKSSQFGSDDEDDDLEKGRPLSAARVSPSPRALRNPPPNSDFAHLTESTYLGYSDPIGEMEFFGEVEVSDGCWAETATRVLSLSRIAFRGLLQTSPRDMRMVLDNVKQRAEQDMLAALLIASIRVNATGGVESFTADRRQSQRASASLMDRGSGSSMTNKGGSASNKGKRSKHRVRKASVFTEAQLSDALALGHLTPLQIAALKHLHVKYDAQCKRIDKLDQSRLNDFLNAAVADDVHVVRRMVRQGMSPNVADYDGRTALMLAAGKGNVRTVQLLLELKADSSMYDNFGNTGMFEACKAGQDKVIEVMLNANAKLHMEQSIVASQMCTSVFEGDLTMLMRLLRAGADPNACDYDKRCALHIAAAEGNLVAMRSMIEEGGADFDFQDRWGNTPKDEALRCGAHLILQYLESINTTRQPLDNHLAWQQHCSHDFLESCFSGHTAHMRYAVKKTPPSVLRTGLMVSAAHKFGELFRELLCVCGSSVLHEEVGHAMLLMAAINGRDDVTQVLVKNNARVVKAPHTDAFLGKLMGHAAMCDYSNTLRRLMRVGLSPNTKDASGAYVLHTATWEGNASAVRALLENPETLVDVADASGRTAHQIARSLGDKGVADALAAALSARGPHSPARLHALSGGTSPR